jgi:glycosyltransferase involved in cell wall biosynthesis
MNESEKERLLRNLDAIATNSPVLSTRLRWPVELTHLSFDNDSNPIYLHHSSWLQFKASADQIETDLQETGLHVFLFGAGFGEYLHYIFNTFDDITVTVWERDPALIRFILMHHDFSAQLTDGSLTFILGVDLFLKFKTLDMSHIVYHPFFSKIYYLERNFIESGNTLNIAALALGGLFVDDLAHSLKENGFLVWPLDLQKWSKEELHYSLAAINPKLLAAINYTNGTAEFCENLQLPFFCWEIDPNMDCDLKIDSNTEFSHICTYRKKNVSQYEQAGFKNVTHLPLASNTQKRKPYNDIENDKALYQAPVAFVGRSMVPETQLYRQKFVELYCIFKKDNDSAEAECENLVQDILDRQLEDGSRFIVPQLFNTHFSDFRQFLLSKNVQVDPEKIISQIAAAERRLLYVASLGELGLHVWGDNDWDRVQQYGVQYRGFAGHHYELNKIYSSAAINIDINRIYQLDIVTMRVFDVLACGGFLIAEYSEELDELFNIGQELESYKTLAELSDKIRYYAENPQSREKIAANGLKAVREKHTFQDRVGKILKSFNLED